MSRWEQFSPNLVKAKSRFEKRGALLETLITEEIIPRLLLANPRDQSAEKALADEKAARLSDRVGELSELTVTQDGAASVAYFERLRAEGIPSEVLFQELLAPTARRLGELWEEDIYDFVEVTKGLGVLQSIVHAYGSEFSQRVGLSLPERRALLMPVPGEQHTFGVSLLSEQFRQEGWRVWSGVPRNVAELRTLVKVQWFDVAGLSASMLSEPAKLASTIKGLRRVSKNPNLIIFVGGGAFARAPELVERVGADATAADAREAVRKVSEMVVSDQQGRVSKNSSRKVSGILENKDHEQNVSPIATKG